MVIVPVRCSCSGEFYQANTSYVIKGGDNYYLIANNTFQGLSTCQALRDQNKFLTGNIYTGSKMNVPLRCACPTKNQTDVGIKYLLTYVIARRDYVSRISIRFGVDTGRTLEANELSEQDSVIYPFTTLLVPLQKPPSSNQTTPSPPPPPSPPTPPPPPPPPPLPFTSEKSYNKWVYLVIGILTGSGLVSTIGIIIFCSLSKTNKKNQSAIVSKSFRPVEKPKQQMIDEDFRDFLESISSIALKVYNFEELQSATQNFSPECLIKGSVYRGEINGDLAAIKKMNGDVLKEINLLNKVNHFNLIRLSGVCFNDGNWYLVYEYAINGSLCDWIYSSDQGKFLSWTQRMRISLGVATGIDYLHSYTSPPHVHQDIKSSNILLDGDFRAKIANFALTRSSEGEDNQFILTRHIVGTKGYMAPEYLEYGLVSPKLDVYAFGVLMTEILSGKEVKLLYGEENEDVPLSDTLGAVIRGEDEEENLHKFMDPSYEGNYPLELVRFVLTLAIKCLRKDPTDRPSMNEIVQSLTIVLNCSLTWELSHNVTNHHSCG